MKRLFDRPSFRMLKEIFIVVLGILIAFWLNNWATKIQAHQTERAYLKAIVEDLKIDLETLNRNQDSVKTLQKKATGLIQHIFVPDLPERNKALMDGFAVLTQAPYFSSNATTYETMINSGDLKYIQDFKLRNKIVAHYKNYENLEQENIRSRVFIESVVIPYYMNYVDFKKMFIQQAIDGETLSNWEDIRFTNILFSYAGIYQAPIQKYENAILRCEALIQSLENDIGKSLE